MLVFRLARRPAWLLGFACMIGGFAFQVSALRFGPLALVQPLLAAELLVVFGYLAVFSRGRGVRRREWLAVVAMSAGLSVFLLAASPSGGRTHAPATLWWISGLAVLALVAVAVTAAWTAVRRAPAHRGPARRAALLGVASGIAWGFVAAVIKELTSRFGGGPAAVLGSWPVYALMGAGAAAMLLTSHAMAAGPLAASQPGFTVADPVVATGLGVFLFGESLRASPAALAGQVTGLIALAAGAAALSRSGLISQTGVTGDGRWTAQGPGHRRVERDRRRDGPGVRRQGVRSGGGGPG